MNLAATPEAIQELLQKLDLCEHIGYPIGFDTESSGPQLANGFLNVYKSSLTGFSVAFVDGSSYYVPYRHLSGPNAPMSWMFKVLAAIVARKAPTYVHNLKHEIKVLVIEGFTRKQLYSSTMLCTQVAMWMLQKPTPGKHPYALKDMVKYRYGYEMTTFDTVVASSPNGMFSGLSSDAPETIKYACEDAIFALRLGKEYVPQMDPQMGATYAVHERKFTHVLAYMEDCGFAIDPVALNKLKDELQPKLEAIDAELDFIAPGVNVNSHTQLRAWGWGAGRWPSEGLPLELTKGAQKKLRDKSLSQEERDAASKLFSTAGDNLEILDGECEPGSEGALALTLLLERAEFQKLLCTYTTSLIEKASEYDDNRLRTSYNQTGTNTGRLSGEQPNLMAIPVRTALGRRVREALVAGPGGTLVSADFSQIDLRVLAHLCGGVGKLAEAYFKKIDVHKQTGDMMEVTRPQGKTANFLIIFGGQGKKLAKGLGCTVEKAKRGLELFMEGYPEYVSFGKRVVDAVQDRGYVKTLLGRRRYLPEIHSQDRLLRWHAERVARNTPVQGGTADVMMLGMIKFYEAILAAGMVGTVKIVAQVHDDLVCETPLEMASEWAKVLEHCLVTAYPLKVPLVAEAVVGTPWSTHKT